jgi:hypothetical protein
MKSLKKIFSSKGSILLTLYFIAIIIGGQVFVWFLYKDIVRKTNYFVKIAINKEEILDAYDIQYTPGKGLYKEVKIKNDIALPILVENNPGREFVFINSIISKKENSNEFSILSENKEYNFKVRDLTIEKMNARMWLLFATSFISILGFYKKIIKGKSPY